MDIAIDNGLYTLIKDEKQIEYLKGRKIDPIKIVRRGYLTIDYTYYRTNHISNELLKLCGENFTKYIYKGFDDCSEDIQYIITKCDTYSSRNRLIITPLKDDYFLLKCEYQSGIYLCDNIFGTLECIKSL